MTWHFQMTSGNTPTSLGPFPWKRGWWHHSYIERFLAPVNAGTWAKWIVSLPILVPRGGQHQESRPLAGSDLLNMRREFTLYSQPIRFVRLDSEHAQNDGKSVNLGSSQRSRFLVLTKRSVASRNENGVRLKIQRLKSGHGSSPSQRASLTFFLHPYFRLRCLKTVFPLLFMFIETFTSRCGFSGLDLYIIMPKLASFKSR